MTSCVWVKASRSHGNGNCVEVAAVVGGVEVRDSKDPEGPVLRFTTAEWLAFADGMDKGEFDHLVPVDAATADDPLHEHLCWYAAGGHHPWPCRHNNCRWTRIKPCPDADYHDGDFAASSASPEGNPDR